MAVQYINGQLYDIWQPSMANIMNPAAAKGSSYQHIYETGRGPIGTPIGMANLNQGGNMSQQGAGMFGDPFGTAMSGTKSGTLQPYINRMTQNADNALNGGLLNYAPQSMVAGDAGGTPVNSTPPQGFNLQPSLLNGEFGKRSWMK